jgi:hypothetical protein
MASAIVAAVFASIFVLLMLLCVAMTRANAPKARDSRHAGWGE